MSTKQLLKDRYKVTGPYPHSVYSIGDIIDFSDGYSSKPLTKTPYDDQWGYDNLQTNYFDADEIKQYPNLFKKLEWWEGRKPEDMPAFIRYGDMAVYRVRWDFSENNLGYIAWAADREDYTLPLQPHVRPATEQEYNEWLNKKPQK